jgi:3-deoxy-D-manno-octulosonic acid kinase
VLLRVRMHRLKSRGFTIGSEAPLTEAQSAALCEAFVRQSGRGGRGLLGRSPVERLTIEEIGPVVIKAFTRGGLLRQVIARKYLRWNSVRSQREYELLKYVRGLGVNAPEPVAFAYKGTIFYRAWLVTREVQEHRTLAEISIQDEDAIPSLFDGLMRQLEILIQNRLFHLDLHPGNVIVNPRGDLYMLDFDKATVFQGSLSSLREKYLRRWRRAVLKHGLPEILSELMCLRLLAHPQE